MTKLYNFLAVGIIACYLPCGDSYSNAVPRIIQGGMGVRISKWSLARDVSRKGELGVISGTAMDTVFIRELQNGDPEGAFRRALCTFPDHDMAARVFNKYFIEGGKAETDPFKSIPMWTTTPSQMLFEVSILANYCEVWLAKHNDDGSLVDGVVGMNLLTKVQLPTVSSLYGAMLADVDYIIMGAGIPTMIPGILDRLAECEDCEYPVDVAGASEDITLHFSPKTFWEKAGKPDLTRPLKRPKFLPIVSSVVLAQSLLKRASGKGPTKGIDGFVIELNTAGGHNAPPRGFKFDPVEKTHVNGLDEKGQPAYGEKDDVNLVNFAKASKGLPFWLAGSYARPDKLRDIVKLGGAGIQAGTVFALCEESGMHDELRQSILRGIADGDLTVFTDPAASPTGFPFKVLNVDDTLSDDDVYNSRPRVCNLGYLRQPYLKEDGKVGFRCPSEPLAEWEKKGGDMESTQGRKCLCNSLCANVGMAQVTKKNGDTYVEPPLVTIGDDINSCRRFLKQDKDGRWSYHASDVIDYLLSDLDKETLEHDTECREPVLHLD